MKTLSDSELLRYSRTIFLDSIDYAGQLKLKNSKVLIIGAGGLGSAVSYYLAASGIGEIYISDDDKVELSNLARQIMHFTKDIGKNKTSSAKEKINALNPQVKVHELSKMTQTTLPKVLEKVNLVLDCSDNFETRFLINQWAKQKKVPLVSGAALRFEGQVMSFLNHEKSPCYQCLFPDTQDNIVENCVDCGVFPPLVGIVGSLQASESIKILLDIGVNLECKMLLIGAFENKFREIKLSQDKNCPICFAQTDSI